MLLLDLYGKILAEPVSEQLQLSNRIWVQNKILCVHFIESILEL